MNKSNRATITTDQIERLIASKEQAKVGLMKLLRGTRNKRPNGISVSMIEGWLSGQITTAHPEHINWVIAQFEDYTPKTKEPAPSNRIKLTSEHLALLKAEKERTGHGTVNILRHIPKPLPKGLTKNIVQSWELETAKSAKETHWNCVIKTYQKLPDLKR